MAKPRKETTMLAEHEPHTTIAPPADAPVEAVPLNAPNWTYIYSPVACPKCRCEEAGNFKPNGNRLDYDGKIIEWGIGRCAECDSLRIAKRTRQNRP